jgi:uncharacterized protein YjaG (DUF416 family)
VPSLFQNEELIAHIHLQKYCASFIQIIEKLSVKAPSGDSKLKVLKAIAQEYNIEWDSSNTEAEFNKKYEDLLVAFANSLLIP